MATPPPDAKPRYSGPLTLTTSQSGLKINRASQPGAFHRDGPRADSEYRDLGLADATGGRIGIKHIRALGPFPKPTGWHWHDMQAHFVYVLRGSISFEFEGVEGPVTLHAGDSISQPAGVPHNVVARSHDCEVLELNLPSDYGTFDLDTSSSGRP